MVTRDADYVHCRGPSGARGNIIVPSEKDILLKIHCRELQNNGMGPQYFLDTEIDIDS